MKKIIICKNCGKEIDYLEVFSGNLCLNCYEKHFETLSDEEKIPVFDKKLLNK